MRNLKRRADLPLLVRDQRRALDRRSPDHAEADASARVGCTTCQFVSPCVGSKGRSDSVMATLQSVSAELAAALEPVALRGANRS